MNPGMEPSNGLQFAERSSTATKCPSLPAEIWRLIFFVGDFDIHDGFWITYDHPTMANICRSCTLFCDLVRPRLYRNFESHVLPEDDDSDWQYFSVAKFAWTISTNPRLASLVRHVSIKGVYDTSRKPSGQATGNPNHPMASVLTNKAAELGMEFRYQKVYTDRHDVNVGFDLVALVLAQLPNMHTLHLFWHDTTTHPVVRMPEPRGGWPWAQSLQKMLLNPCDTAEATDWCVPPSDIARFSLGRILPLLSSGGSLTRLVFIKSTGPSLALPLENLRELSLTSCCFRASELRNLLQNCKYLRKFAYSATHRSENPDRSDGATALEIVEALEPTYSSLEALDIDLRRWDGPRDRRIPSFQQFVALKILHIDLDCVWNWQAASNEYSPPSPDVLFTTLLPESIERIGLFNTDARDLDLAFEVEAHVKRLALDIKEKGTFRQLKKLRCQGFWPFGYDLPVDSSPLTDDDIVSRITALNGAKALLSDNGVEVIFDEEWNLELGFDRWIS